MDGASHYIRGGGGGEFLCSKRELLAKTDGAENEEGRALERFSPLGWQPA